MEPKLGVAYIHLHYFWPERISQGHEDGIEVKGETRSQASDFFLPISSFVKWYTSSRHIERWKDSKILLVCFPFRCSLCVFSSSGSNLHRCYGLNRHEDRETSFPIALFGVYSQPIKQAEYTVTRRFLEHFCSKIAWRLELIA